MSGVWYSQAFAEGAWGPSIASLLWWQEPLPEQPHDVWTRTDLFIDTVRHYRQELTVGTSNATH